MDIDNVRLPGYMEIVNRDLQVHILLHGEEYGGAMELVYCPLCGGPIGECSCQPFNMIELKEELEDIKKKYKEGCEYCRGEKPLVPSVKELYSQTSAEITIDGDSLMLELRPGEVGKDETVLARFISYCPNCGRRLKSSSEHDGKVGVIYL